jgi:ribose 5-phosphate isomerase A
MPQQNVEQEKQLAGEKAVDYAQSGMVVGLGTGSTANYAIRALGQRIREGLSIRAIPTSEQTRQLAEKAQIPLVDFTETPKTDLTIDGADEVDPQLVLIKGAGGALLREKIVASISKELIIIVDSSKYVTMLGKFPLPVEVTPFGWQTVARRIECLGAEITLRKKGEKVFVTDNQNYILDCHFEEITDPQSLEARLNAIPGVVINGLFVGMTARCIVGRGDAIEIIERKR